MTTGSEALARAITEAQERLTQPGIEGWGINYADDLVALFDRVVVGDPMGCTSETCHHHSHDPAAPIVRLVPRTGRLHDLGAAGDEAYYALVTDDDVMWFRLDDEGRARWPWLQRVQQDDVPDYLLAVYGEAITGTTGPTGDRW